jgi:putative peptidoglycan binding protein
MSESGPGRPAARRRWAAAGAAAAVVAAGVTAGVLRGSGSPAAPAAGTFATSTATVTRRSLSAQAQLPGTLGDAGSYSAVNQAPGTITALPAPGRVLRQGQVLYQVSGVPVALLYGTVPAWRSLSEGMTGPDVTQLNTDLVALRYASSALLGPRPGWDYFSGQTAAALARLQARLGLPATGSLVLGQAVFLPAAAQVSALGTGVVLGGAAQPGTVILTATSTVPVVTADLDPGQQAEVRAGDQVMITLPDGAVTPGVVRSVAVTAAAPAGAGSGSSDEGNSDAGSAGSGAATITATVALRDPAAASGLNQAPVTVTVTSGSVAGALVVPVDALLAQPAPGNGAAGGGYAVEVTGPGGQHLVAVTPGLFDDAAGLVQVTGTKLAAGQHVVVPGS